MLLAFGTTATFINANQAKSLETNADGAVSGVLTIDTTGESWASNSTGQHFAVYFYDGEKGVDSPSNSGWSSYVFGTQNEYLIRIPYNLSFTPTYMVAVRYADWYTESRWEAHPWGEYESVEYPNVGKWSQNEDLAFVANGNIVVAGEGYSFVGYPYTEGKCAENDWGGDGDWDKIADFDHVKTNDDNHAVYYLSKTITQWEEFGVKIFDSFYAWEKCDFSENIVTSNWKQNGANIQYTNTESLDVIIYFDRNAGRITIDDPTAAALSEANGWAQQFLGETEGTNNCTYSKANWGGNGDSFVSRLTEGAKQLFIDEAHVNHDAIVAGYLGQSVQRYDYVLELYGVSEYPDFMGRVDAKKVTPKSATRYVPFENKEVGEKSIWLIGVVAIGVLITGFVFITFARNRREY